jgi:hypothetical protein
MKLASHRRLWLACSAVLALAAFAVLPPALADDPASPAQKAADAPKACSADGACPASAEGAACKMCKQHAEACGKLKAMLAEAKTAADAGDAKLAAEKIAAILAMIEEMQAGQCKEGCQCEKCKAAAATKCPEGCQCEKCKAAAATKCPEGCQCEKCKAAAATTPGKP